MNNIIIPKIIHAIWFGFSTKNEVIQASIKSWQEKMPDYKIMWWTEDTVDINTLPDFAKYAYKNKRWAYVADVVRFQKMYEYGGVYLDTDMLIIKDPTELFYSPLSGRASDSVLRTARVDETDISIWGMEDKDYVSCGIIACNKGNNLMRDLGQFYNEYYKTHNMNVVIEVPKIVTKFINDEFNKYPVIVYPTEYFYPLPAAYKKEDYRKFLTEKSYAVHLWNYSWQTLFMKIMRKVKIVQLGKAIVPKGLRPFVINTLRRLKLN